MRYYHSSLLEIVKVLQRRRHDNSRYGDDKAFGGRGNDEIFGMEGNDNLGGGPGDDLIIGGPRDDNLNGPVGNDFLDGGDHDVRGDFCQNVGLYGFAVNCEAVPP